MPDSSESSTPFAAIRTVTRGASIFFLGTGANNVLRFLISLLLTRSLGTLYGLYVYGTTLLSLASVFTNLGTNQSILKFIPEYENDPENQNRILGLAYLTTFVASLVVGVVAYIIAPVITDLTFENPLMTDVIRLFAIVLPFDALIKTIGNVFRSVELPEYQVLTTSVGLQAFRLGAIAVAIALGAAFIGVIAAMVVAWVIAFAFGLWLVLSRTSFRPTFGGNSKDELVEFYNFSVPLTISESGSFLQNRIDILMLGVLVSTAGGVGVYRIATVLGGFLTMPLNGFNKLFPSIASGLYARGELAELDSLYTRVTRWSFTLSLLPSIALVIYANEALSIFGEEFVGGAGILILFVFAQFTNAAVGPCGYVLMMTDHQYLSMIDEWVLGISNAVLNYIFIVNFGVIGAALATAGTIATVNLIQVGQIWYTEGLFPFSLAFAKPVAAGVVAAVVMYVCGMFLSGFVLLVAGSAVGTVAYTGVIFATGIETEDREFFAEIIPWIGS